MKPIKVNKNQIKLTGITIENHGNSEFHTWNPTEYRGIPSNFFFKIKQNLLSIPMEVPK